MKRSLIGNDGKAQIVLGDKTSHGGVVISGSLTSTWSDAKIPIVRMGDKVTCPKCKPHIFEVAEGLPTYTDTNANLPIAVDGHKTTCGAILIAESASANTIASALAIANLDKHRYDELIQALDKSTGLPLSGITYFIERTDGVTFFGETDQDGKCPRITSESSQELKVWFGLAAEKKQSMVPA